MTVYAGFDAYVPPSPALWPALRAMGLVFTGSYLVAPSHPSAAWAGTRAALLAAGIASVPIFVGQETVGPGSHAVTPEQGRLDGQRLAAAMLAGGWPRGSWCFPDLENGPPYGVAQTGYEQAVEAEAELEGWRMGAYCSYLLAPQVAASLKPGARIWPWRVQGIGGTATAPFPTPPLADSGYADAVLWQRAQNVTVDVAGTPVQMDLNVSTLEDPSAP